MNRLTKTLIATGLATTGLVGEVQAQEKVPEPVNCRAKLGAWAEDKNDKYKKLKLAFIEMNNYAGN